MADCNNISIDSKGDPPKISGLVLALGVKRSFLFIITNENLINNNQPSSHTFIFQMTKLSPLYKGQEVTILIFPIIPFKLLCDDWNKMEVSRDGGGEMEM